MRATAGATSGGERELVLLYRFLHPGAQSGFLESPEERLLGAVVLHRRLLGLVVAAGPHRSDPQGRGELREVGKWQNGHEKRKPYLAHFTGASIFVWWLFSLFNNNRDFDSNEINILALI